MVLFSIVMQIQVMVLMVLVMIMVCTGMIIVVGVRHSRKWPKLVATNFLSFCSWLKVFLGTGAIGVVWFGVWSMSVCVCVCVSRLFLLFGCFFRSSSSSISPGQCTITILQYFLLEGRNCRRSLRFLRVGGGRSIRFF